MPSSRRFCAKAGSGDPARVLVKIGNGEWTDCSLSYQDLKSTRRIELLEKLADSTRFKKDMEDLKLGQCPVVSGR